MVTNKLIMSGQFFYDADEKRLTMIAVVTTGEGEFVGEEIADTLVGKVFRIGGVSYCGRSHLPRQNREFTISLNEENSE